MEETLAVGLDFVLETDLSSCREEQVNSELCRIKLENPAPNVIITVFF